MTTAIHSKKKAKAIQPIATKIFLPLFFIAWFYLYKTSSDHTDWWIENILVILFFSVLLFTRKRFRFSQPALVFIFLFLLLHLYGAEGAYTHNQFGEFLKQRYHLVRNPYDRIVHFSFGFLMAYPMLELMQQKFRETKRGIFLIVNMAILSLATIFELIEWGVAAVTDKATGETYVATQGDPWDAQKDIILALIGSILFTYILKFIRNKNSKLKFSDL